MKYENAKAVGVRVMWLSWKLFPGETIDCANVWRQRYAANSRNSKNANEARVERPKRRVGAGMMRVMAGGTDQVRLNGPPLG